MSVMPDSVYEAPKRTSNELYDDPLLIELPRETNGDIEIGGVVLQSTIGEGGMGRVYLGWHRRLGIPVAVKVLKQSCAGDVPLFHKEGHLTARVEHPNLIRIFDIDVEPVSKLNYMVIEYIDGASAYQLLESQIARAGRPLSEIAAVNVCASAAKALGAVHSAGVVHCDVKADNILIRHLDSAVKLTDLGLASRQCDISSDKEHKYSVAGTIGFVSPEVLRGDAPTPRSDVYSLGVTLYELISGELPHGAPYDHTYTVRQLTEPPIPLHSIFGGFNPKVISIVNRCLEADPAKRFENGEKLAASLEEVMQHLSGSTSDLSGVASVDDKPRILCVDDDPDVLETIKFTLEAGGFQPICFTDAREALFELKRVDPQVAVLDLQLQGMNGLQLAQALRDVEGYGDLAVVMLSGQCSQSVISNALERNVTDYLVKPLNSNELIVRLRLLSKLRAMNQERGEIETHLKRLKSSLLFHNSATANSSLNGLEQPSPCLCHA
jgi:serine/threonine protein kinase